MLYWLFLLPWHLGFIFIITFHILCFFAAVAMVGGLDIAAGSAQIAGKVFYYILLVTGGIAFVTGTFGSIGMPIVRLADRGLRTYSMPMNYFNYLFFLVVYGSGLFAWLVLDPTFDEYRAYWVGLITLTPPALHPMTILHIVLFDLFLIYLPFTRSTHYITRILAYFFIRWDDEPNLPGSKLEKQISGLLGRKVSWEGKHIPTGKSWAEAATESGLPEREIRTTHEKEIHIDDFTRPGGQVTELDPAELMPLPPPYDKMEKPPIKKLTEDQRKRMDASLDGIVAIGLAPRQAPEEEKALSRSSSPGLKSSSRGEQLDLSPASHALPRLLREVPDLHRCVPGLRCQRPPGHLSAHDSPGSPSPDHQQVHQEGAPAPQEASRGATSSSTGRPWRGLRSWPTGAPSAGAAPRSARWAATTPSSAMKSGSSSARRWASPPRSCTRRGRSSS